MVALPPLVSASDERRDAFECMARGFCRHLRLTRALLVSDKYKSYTTWFTTRRLHNRVQRALQTAQVAMFTSCCTFYLIRESLGLFPHHEKQQKRRCNNGSWTCACLSLLVVVVVIVVAAVAALHSKSSKEHG